MPSTHRAACGRPWMRCPPNGNQELDSSRSIRRHSSTRRRHASAFREIDAVLVPGGKPPPARARHPRNPVSSRRLADEVDGTVDEQPQKSARSPSRNRSTPASTRTRYALDQLASDRRSGSNLRRRCRSHQIVAIRWPRYSTSASPTPTRPLHRVDRTSPAAKLRYACLEGEGATRSGHAVPRWDNRS